MLLAHRGDAHAGAEAARRGLLEPHMAHPFAAGHGHLSLSYSLAVSGRWSEALDTVDDFDALIARQDDHRFPPVAANMRGWLLRGAGRLDAAFDLHQAAAQMAPGPTLLEAHYAALLDQVECFLGAQDLEGAARALGSCSDIVDWTGSMHWRHRTRYRLLRNRLASLSGEHVDSAQDLRAIAAEAEGRGDRRYARRALVMAAAADARAGANADLDALVRLTEEFLPLSGPDGWRDVAELASAAGSDELWGYAEKQASAIAAEASTRPGFDGSAAAKAMRTQLERLRP
jgi:hypothetical protein